MNATLAPPFGNASDPDGVRIQTPYVMRCLSLAIGALGLTGNAFVVVVIANAPAMRKHLTNAFIMNQSVVDGSVSTLLVFTTIFEDDGRRYQTLLDDIFCRVWLTKLWLWSLFVSSSYNLVALTLERYLAVVHPIWHKMKLTRAKVAGSIAFVWTVGPAYNMAYMLPTAGITSSGSCTVYSIWPDPLSQRLVGVLTIAVQFLFPLGLLVFFYARMIVVLRRRVNPEAATAAEQPTSARKPDSMARARKNILKTLAIVAFSFVFCWMWNQVYFLLFNVGLKGVVFTSVFYNFTVVMVFMNCCINPFIYIAKYEQFQRATRKLFCRITTDHEESVTQNAAVE